MTWRIRAASRHGNTYFTSNRGIIKSTGAAAVFTLAGMPPCLDLTLSLTAGTGTLLDDGVTVSTDTEQGRGYRAVWCKRDANNNLIIGVPSARFWLNNNGGVVKNITVVTRLPPEITTEHFLQLYATEIMTDADTIDKLDPDEVALCVAAMAVIAYVVADMPERLPR